MKKDIENGYANGNDFAWDNCEIFYRKMGSGPALLMVHGFPTAGCDWRDMALELSKSFTIIAADIADAGHFPLIEAPQECVEGVTAFQRHRCGIVGNL